MLTAQGLDTLGNAAPAHVESVRHHFIDRLARRTSPPAHSA
ncbi:hypothetical protein ACWELO_04165 [Streptomyces sp. NPDC004596]